MHDTVWAAIVASVLCSGAGVSRADTFVMKDGGRVYGLVEAEEKDKESVVWSVIRTSYGRVRVQKAQIAKTLASEGRKDTLYLEESRVTFVKGKALRSSDDGATWQAIPWGAQSAGATSDARDIALPVLKAGERLRTEEASQAVLDVGYGTVVVDASSELKLKREAGATINLLRGRIGSTLEGLPRERRFRVETPQASLAVKGTTFLADAGGRCAVEQGEVELMARGAAGVVAVAAGTAVDEEGRAGSPTKDELDLMLSARGFPRVPAPDWVVIQGDEFEMGAKWQPGGAWLDVRPPHAVRVGSFLISRYETSGDQFDAFRTWCSVNAKSLPIPAPLLKPPAQYDAYDVHGKVVPNSQTDPALPAAVTWTEADSYCRWMGAALVSEAQWEFVARHRISMRKSSILDDTQILETDWCLENSGEIEVPALPMEYGGDDGKKRFQAKFRPRVHSPGTRLAGPAGVCDLFGNLHEWTADTAIDGYTGAPADGSARVDSREEKRVVRGRCFWRSAAQFGMPMLAAFERGVALPTELAGVRAVRSLPR